MVCLFSPFREEALSDAQWWHPTGVPPPPAQYQSSAEGCYQHRDAPPTTRDPLITSCTTWPAWLHDALLLHKPSLTRHTNSYSQTVTKLWESNRVWGLTDRSIQLLNTNPNMFIHGDAAVSSIWRHAELLIIESPLTERSQVLCLPQHVCLNSKVSFRGVLEWEGTL